METTGKKRRIAFFNYSDVSSGAEALIGQTVATLCQQGVEARLYVMDQFTKGSYAIPHFFGERRLEYIFRRLTGRNNILFPSTFFLSKRPWIMEADIWHFHNLHGHFASIPLLATHSRNRPIVLSPVDQFLATGYCTYTLGCERFRNSCGCCPQLGSSYPGLTRDTTSALLAMKKSALSKSKFNILVHTKYLADYYRSTFVGDRPIEQIYYGVDTRIFAPRDREIAAKALGVDPANGRFTVALLHSDLNDKRKRLFQMLEPLQQLANRRPGQLRVLVIGRSSEQAQRFSTSTLPVVTLPFLESPADLAGALNLGDVLLYPTAADNLSLTCLNAMSCGMPVISSNVGGQGEAIKDEMNGFLCDPERLDLFIDRVEKLISAPDVLNKLASAARQTIVEHFDINTYVTKLIAYYDKLIAAEISQKQSA
jgi:glycosyltransferase involved in cell wall biosynthesis